MAPAMTRSPEWCNNFPKWRLLYRNSYNEELAAFSPLLFSVPIGTDQSELIGKTNPSQ